MSSKARGLADLGNAFDDGAITGTNMVINGAMQVAQRGTSVTGGTSGYNTADRWYLRRTASGVTFDSDVTGGVLTCENPSSAAGFDLRHGVEWEDWFYGKTMTLTFTATTGSGTIHVDASVVEGSVSATTSEEFCHLQGTTTDITDYEGSGLVQSGNNYKITFDVPSDADVSFTPDMLRIAVGNTSASAQSITLANVQLEVGDTATPFEHRSYGDELQRCKRYYQEKNSSGDALASGIWYTASQVLAYGKFDTTMRAPPTITVSSSDFASCYTRGTARTTLDSSPCDNIRANETRYNLTVGVNGTQGDGTHVQLRSNEAIYFDAEL